MCEGLGGNASASSGATIPPTTGGTSFGNDLFNPQRTDRFEGMKPAPTTSSTAFAAIGAAGGVLSAGGQIMAGLNAKKAGKANAKSLLKEAKRTKLAAAEDAQMVTRRANIIAGQQRAALAAQGVETDTGTAALLQEETAEFGAEEVLKIKENAAIAAWGIRERAIQAELQGRLDFNASLTRAGSSLLGAGVSADQAGLFG